MSENKPNPSHTAKPGANSGQTGLTPREVAAKHRQSELRRERSRRAVIGGAIIAVVAAIVIIAALLFKKNNEDSQADVQSKGPAPAYGNQYGGVVLGKGGKLQKAGGFQVDPGTVGPAAKEASSKAPSGSAPTKKGGPGQIIVYVDMLCPHCGEFEKMFGDYLAGLADKGTATVEYRVISILDQSVNQNYSTRAGGAMMSVADKFPDKFVPAMRAMFEQQPNESAGAGNDKIKEILKGAGVPGEIEKMVDNGDFRYYTTFANKLAAHEGVSGTPSIYVEGSKWDPQADSDFQKFVEERLAARK
ncbi:DsbA family protein [Arthrobacter sp. UM1]|uniref:DsbA family protein n=1 Tax=Arthrobacter sp. UM1 TaxID=2766776 RepID=UPI001CF62BA9|nr:thioredoxin domain-containing protein [Arthrobacter sp. UM1]MCB4207825.1 thioredoxin domain-containing protein [Arthrobacter sp. UM1]